MTRPGRTGACDPASKSRPALGVVEWFRPGEHDRVEAVADGLRRLGIRHLRTGVSWADCHHDKGRDWIDWLLPRLARDFEILPCFVYTPPSLGVVAKTAAPPRDPKAFADFLDVFITRHGRYFEWMELWNEPNNHVDWDSRLDPGWLHFCTMIGAAAYWCRHRGKKTVLAGSCPSDPNLLDLFCRRGVVDHIDAVGIHGFPGTWDHDWDGWRATADQHRAVLDAHGLAPALWITEAGYSTWRHDEATQIRAFLDALDAPVDRVYWYSYQDLHPDLESQEGFHFDERHYFAGLLRANGTPKLLHRLLASGGVEAAERVDRLRREGRPHAARRAGPRSRTLIMGGAGFIGTNLADRLARAGRQVLILDSLARPGVEENLAWLLETHGDAVAVETADIRDRHAVEDAVRHADQVFHFAAQVAVTTSLVDPVTDFAVNAQGTLNLLEALRRSPTPPPLVFTSTNKVYGKLGDVSLSVIGDRYEPTDEALRGRGVGEARPLDFYSPYGCSKGAADQYVLDYARTFGLPATVFRMSCIYGPHQHGTEDQGWVAHFLMSAVDGRPVTLYGDGRQVRDILFVEDLLDALLAAQSGMRICAGHAFNIGGGPSNAVSLLELLRLLGRLTGRRVEVAFDAWRPGDQRYYVSDTTKITTAVGWRPKTGVADGIGRLHRWIVESRLKPTESTRHTRFAS